ncbi:MAG: DUF3828 domain-containing protein [Anaerolineae bacterium]
MRSHRLVNLALALGMAVTTAGCSALSAKAITPAEPTATVVTAAIEADAPEQVVQGFYGWYLEYAGGEEPKNPLVDGAYRERAELAPELIAEADALVESPEGIHFDPFLQAQDVPTEVSVGAAEIEGDSATVQVTTSFAGHLLDVDLVRMDGAWRIRHIARAEDAAAPQTQAAEGVAADTFVNEFYAWYVGYLQSGSDGPRSPLRDGAYKEVGYFSPAYTARLEEILADEDLRADPILCAQDIPESLSVVDMHRGETGAMVLIVASSFEGHRIEVTLIEGGAKGWQIDDIRSVSK